MTAQLLSRTPIEGSQIQSLLERSLNLMMLMDASGLVVLPVS